MGHFSYCFSKILQLKYPLIILLIKTWFVSEETAS